MCPELVNFSCTAFTIKLKETTVMQDLLFEIGTEELPASFQAPALKQLKEKFINKAKELKVEHGEINCFATPRRLAITVKDIIERQEDSREELLGPSKKAAFDAEGNPTKAAEGFARSKNASVNDLKLVETPKGEYLMLVREVKGQESTVLLPGVLKEIILELSFAKSMKWGSNLTTFARPIQWILALFGNTVLPIEHDGITSSNITRGHRFLANIDFEITSVDKYESELLEKYVVADPKKRRDMVIVEIKKAVSESHQTKGDVAVDENLVDTVNNLVEYPYGVCGVFDEKFLQLPDEVLTTSMREHQKYFTVVDGEGKLVSSFVAVNNTKVNNEDVTRKGHQRVLRARLEDALFFFEKDKQQKLADRIDSLNGIVFQAKLGTMAEKSERIVKLTRVLADLINPALVDDACRVATLCKADLMSDMVGEFPSLQGVMGAAYSLHDGEKENISIAIKEHYMPKRSGALIPTSDLGAIVGLADRFDTIAGCFGIGQTPTGTADPFGLRRLTLAVLHIIEGKGYKVSLSDIVRKALALYGDKVDGSSETVETILDFMKGRYANDSVAKGNNAGAVDAVISVNFDDILDSDSRITALLDVRSDESFNVLAGSFKRIRNIIKSNKDIAVDTTLFEHDAEKELHSLFVEVEQEMNSFIDQSNYLAALKAMLKMKEPVDNFFDNVMVMAEDEQVKANRLNLLTALASLILGIGDISKMQD